MIVYTYSEARQNLATLLDKVVQEGEVRIRRKDGQVFVVKLEQGTDSPLDIEGIELDLTASDILSAIQEGRRIP